MRIFRRQSGAFNESQRSFGIARRHKDLVEGTFFTKYNHNMLKQVQNSFQKLIKNNLGSK